MFKKRFFKNKFTTIGTLIGGTLFFIPALYVGVTIGPYLMLAYAKYMQTTSFEKLAYALGTPLLLFNAVIILLFIGSLTYAGMYIGSVIGEFVKHTVRPELPPRERK